MALLFSFASCDNGSTSSPSKNNSDIDHSLGTPPDETLKIPDSKLEVDENCAEGIYIEFDVPEKTWQVRVYIDEIGQVAEAVWLNESGDKGSFFYPFVAPGKEYTVRITFLKEEDTDSNGFVLNTPNQTIGWFDAKVTAGKNSKGEVKLTDKGKIEVKDNGDFKFIEKPTFYNESYLTGSGYDWMVDVALVEGISWEHGDARKTKWRAEIDFPRTVITQTHNLYSNNYFLWKDGGLTKVDFLCIRPRMHYTYDGKEYTYQWDSFCYDTPSLKLEAELWTEIDVNNSADVEKIKGTWKYSDEWEGWHDKEETLKIKCFYEETLVIGSQNVTKTYGYTYSKPDGDAFTKKEIAEHWTGGYWYSNEKPNDDTKYYWYEEGNFSWDNSEESYKYKIYDTLRDNATLSSENTTITEKYDNEPEPISEYFKNEDDENYSCHYTFKLFEGGSTLRIIRSGTNEGESYEWWNDYKKVK